jgi:hypothetical protein
MKTQQQKKNQRLIILIFSLSFIPFLMAWYLKEHPGLLVARSNNGTLITPLVTTELANFVGVDPFSRDNITQLQGHWVLINVIPKAACTAACREALHSTQQLLLMMGKDLVRIRRAALLLTTVEPAVAAAWWQNDSRLLRIYANETLRTKINSISKAEAADGLLLLMDPLGNLMMYYAPGFDPYKVRDDLKKLLAASQIG